MITLLVAVVGRLAVVQGVDGAAYANAAQQDRLRTYPIAALRGAVLDRARQPVRLHRRRLPRGGRPDR